MQQHQNLRNNDEYIFLLYGVLRFTPLYGQYKIPKMLYPIPQAELDANPNMAGEQNDQY